MTAGSVTPYAVIDTATTGLDPDGGHRVKELAVIIADHELNRTGPRFETMVDPERDFDLRHIDGITPVHMIGARPFSDYAWQIARLLDGHILIAHCLDFHARFISNELLAAGVDHDPGRGVCTLELAGASRWPLSRPDAMAHHGIAWQGVKGQSMAEAIGCLELARAGDAIGAPLGGRPFRLLGSAPVDHTPAAPLHRSRGDAAVDVVEQAHSHLLSIPEAGSDEFNHYLYIVSMYLTDEAVGPAERRDLDRLRIRIDLSEDQVRWLHFLYVEHVAKRAAADGVVDEREWTRIATIGRQLDIGPEVDAIIAKARGRAS